MDTSANVAQIDSKRTMAEWFKEGIITDRKCKE